MRKELRIRAILYGALPPRLRWSLIWPPVDWHGQAGKIRLGLDLRGGMHLVLQVVIDDALNATIDDAVQTTRDQANRKGIVFASAARADHAPPSRWKGSSPRG